MYHPAMGRWIHYGVYKCSEWKYLCYCFSFSCSSIHSLCLFAWVSTHSLHYFISCLKFHAFLLFDSGTVLAFSIFYRIVLFMWESREWALSMKQFQAKDPFYNWIHKFFMWCFILAIFKLLLFIVLTWMH